MNDQSVNWDTIPDVITKDQLYQICHISKSTAQYPLQSGKIPCEYTGKKTRRYKIRRTDVIAYLKERKVFPESYSAPAGWYGGKYPVKMETTIPEFVLEELKVFYTEMLKSLPDVLNATDAAKLTGYGKTSINNWCKKGLLKSFQRGQMNYIPKIYLVEFFCSTYFRTITRKSDWHIKTLKRFSRWQKQRMAKGDGING